MLALFLPLLLLWKLVLCASPRSLTEIVISELINMLNARDLGIELPAYENEDNAPKVSYLEIQETDKFFLDAIPEDVLFKIFEFMDFKDFKYFLELSKLCNVKAKQWIRTRLTSFCPHFLSRDYRVNQLLAFEIPRYFDDCAKIDDADVCDQYEQACIENINKHRVTPRTKLSYIIQSFIHEYLYGSDSPIPVTESQWKMILFLKLNDPNNASRNYSMSVDRIIQINRSIIDKEFDDPMDRMKLNDYLNLFVKCITSYPLTIENFQEFMREKQLLGLDARHLKVSFEKEIDLLLKILFHERYVTEENAALVLLNVFENGLYAKSLFSRAALTAPYENITEELRRTQYSSNRMLLSHVLDVFPDQEFPMKHMFIRDPYRPETRDVISEDEFSNIARASSPSLTYLHTFIKFISIRNATNETNTLPSLTAFLIYKWGNDATFEIMFSDCVDQKFKVLFRVSATPNLNCIFDFDFNGLNPTKMRIFLKHFLKKRDPLPLIFIKPQWLFEFADLITDRFVLNKRYRIDIRENDFIRYRHIAALSDKIGQIITFKEIIQEIESSSEVGGLMKLFSLTEFPKPNNADLVISFSDFINH